MPQEQGEREHDAHGHEDVFKGFAYFLVTRCLAELVEKCVLIGCRSGLVSLPLANGNGMDARELREFNLVKAEIAAQPAYIQRLHALRY